MSDYEIFLSPDHKRCIKCSCNTILVVDNEFQCRNCGKEFQTTVEEKQ